VARAGVSRGIYESIEVGVEKVEEVGRKRRRCRGLVEEECDIVIQAVTARVGLEVTWTLALQAGPHVTFG
jgi:hypothetical protein